MTTPLVLAIEPLRVLAVEPLHAAGEGLLGSLDDQVSVSRHQDVGVDDPLVSARGLAEELDKAEVVRSGSEDPFPFVAAGRQMPDGAGILESQRSRHTQPSLPR